VKLPRDLSGKDLMQILTKLGYRVVRQKGSHAIMVYQGPPRHKVAIPLHAAVRVGTLAEILREVSLNLGIAPEDILRS